MAGAAQRAYVGLGGNLGDARATVQAGLAALAAHADVALVACSSLYRSAPVEAGGPDFINAVAAIDTALSPAALLAVLQAIELDHGRQRPYRNAPRTLDLDLLWYDGIKITTPRLILPHPRMHQRAFVLEPLMELTPTLQLPQGSVETLLNACSDQKIWLLQGQ
jgi:2-amino-4-hydroxy-6-hydroxymethyldihydropteridine diphosphokinase